MAGYNAEPEPEKGNGRIDLKVSHPSTANKIIEFKGWWNNDRRNVVNQLRGYLTDFEREGHVFMINNKRASIEEEYKEIIMAEEMSYTPGTWLEVVIEPSGYLYLKSEHNFIRKKTVYHFIISIY